MGRKRDIENTAVKMSSYMLRKLISFLSKTSLYDRETIRLGGTKGMCNERQRVSLIIRTYKNVKALEKIISPQKDILGSFFWGGVREFLAGQN